MITSNALGHFVLSRAQPGPLQDRDKLGALESAMRTIHNAYMPNRPRTQWAASVQLPN